MNKTFIIILVSVLIMVFLWTSREETQQDSAPHSSVEMVDEDEEIEIVEEEPDNEDQDVQPEAANPKKKIDFPDEEKQAPKKKQKPQIEVNENGRKMIPEKEPGKKSLKAADEFDDQDIDLEQEYDDYDRIPQPEKPKKWDEY